MSARGSARPGSDMSALELAREAGTLGVVHPTRRPPVHITVLSPAQVREQLRARAIEEMLAWGAL